MSINSVVSLPKYEEKLLAAFHRQLVASTGWERILPAVQLSRFPTPDQRLPIGTR